MTIFSKALSLSPENILPCSMDFGRDRLPLPLKCADSLLNSAAGGLDRAAELVFEMIDTIFDILTGVAGFPKMCESCKWEFSHAVFYQRHPLDLIAAIGGAHVKLRRPCMPLSLPVLTILHSALVWLLTKSFNKTIFGMKGALASMFRKIQGSILTDDQHEALDELGEIEAQGSSEDLTGPVWSKIWTALRSFMPGMLLTHQDFHAAAVWCRDFSVIGNTASAMIGFFYSLLEDFLVHVGMWGSDTEVKEWIEKSNRWLAVYEGPGPEFSTLRERLAKFHDEKRDILRHYHRGRQLLTQLAGVEKSSGIRDLFGKEVGRMEAMIDD